MKIKEVQGEQIRYMLSFLAILVHKAGDEIVIENLSDYSSTMLHLEMNLDVKENKVTLSTTVDHHTN